MTADHRDTFTRDKLKMMSNDGMKTVIIRDAAGRIQEVYEADIKIEIGESCLLTRIKYSDGAAGTSRQVVAYEEEVVAWPGYEILNAGYANDINNVP